MRSRGHSRSATHEGDRPPDRDGQDRRGRSRRRRRWPSASTEDGGGGRDRRQQATARPRTSAAREPAGVPVRRSAGRSRVRRRALGLARVSVPMPLKAKRSERDRRDQRQAQCKPAEAAARCRPAALIAAEGHRREPSSAPLAAGLALPDGAAAARRSAAGEPVVAGAPSSGEVATLSSARPPSRPGAARLLLRLRRQAGPRGAWRGSVALGPLVVGRVSTYWSPAEKSNGVSAARDGARPQPGPVSAAAPARAAGSGDPRRQMRKQGGACVSVLLAVSQQHGMGSS